MLKLPAVLSLNLTSYFISRRMVRSRPSRNTVPPSYASNSSRSGGSTGSDDSQPVPGTTEQPLEIMETVPEERPNTSSEPASARPPTRGPPSKRAKVESSSSAGMDSCTVEVGPRIGSHTTSSATRTRPRASSSSLVYTSVHGRMVPPRQPTRAELSLDGAYLHLPCLSGLQSRHLRHKPPLHASQTKNLMLIADSTPMSSSSPRVMTPVYLSDTSPVATGT